MAHVDRITMPDLSGDKWIHSLAYHAPRRSHVHCPILDGQVVSAHSPWFHT